MTFNIVRIVGLAGVLFALLSLALAPTTSAQQKASLAELDPIQARKLAELMCRQLPNVGTILEIVQIKASNVAPAPVPPREPFVTDDVYDALIQLGPYSLPCLTDRLLDTRWMPDPRSEPLLGIPIVGDVAYMILGDKGVHDVMPALTHKKPDDLRMDDYFTWPSASDHRQRLQNAVRAWLRQNPNCCGTPPVLRATAPSTMKFRMSAANLANAQAEFSRLRPGMSPAQVLKIVGKPDGVDRGLEEPGHENVNLLGFCANNHNENLAYIYFIERWTDDIGRRDPLRDRYVIVFFSAESKLTRMLSNVANIPAVFPASQSAWERLMWGEPIKKN